MANVSIIKQVSSESLVYLVTSRQPQIDVRTVEQFLALVAGRWTFLKYIYPALPPTAGALDR